MSQDMDDQAAIDQAASEWFARRRLSQETHPHEAGADNDEAEFKAWLEADARHAAAYGLMERTFDDILWAVPNSGFGERTRRLSWRTWTYALLAGAACVAGALVLINMPSVRTESTGIGQTRQLALADGSQITLAGRSSVEIRYSRSERRVTLKQGEAYFSVVHNAARPFLVRVGDVDVRDVGTRFDVNLRPSSLEVDVLEGRVAVAYAKSADAATQLAAGDSLRVPTRPQGATDGENWQVHHQAQSATAWNEGRMVYDNAPLGDIVADLNRYYAPGVTITSPAVADQRLTTSFAVTDIDTFLNTLPVVANVSLQRNANGAVVILQRNKDEYNKS
ncbi:FecR domain-containing protein [Asticcacaulis sp. EMRT-3]|uniref:FecR family protein n=1 Tax=Asticcacaulis sp. EMRT-3 TaxID=3040349 RepID=UPI0024AEEDF0|nr:FecR domain-containing protein [Asticcacaulis sp. EMRT-3]MDI7775939.1 FecR domain-containing protein [Asticcacaulis sp. EMRT-3]